MKTLELFDMWAAAYAIASGVKLVKVLPGQWVRFVFDDSHGQASRALGEWRSDKALVSGRMYAEAFRQVRRLVRS